MLEEKIRIGTNFQQGKLVNPCRSYSVKDREGMAEAWSSVADFQYLLVLHHLGKQQHEKESGTESKKEKVKHEANRD